MIVTVYLHSVLTDRKGGVIIKSVEATEKMIQKDYPSFKFTVLGDTPVTPLSRPLNRCKLALITTGGLYLKADKPFDCSPSGGNGSYRMLPADIRHEDISVSHKWYNHKYINSDINCVFPVDRMREYVREGKIESLSEEYYSFMGHIFVTGPLIENAKKIGKRLKELGVDIAFLTPV